MGPEVLAAGVVELGIDDIKLRDELPGSLKRVSDGLASAFKSTKYAADVTEKMYKTTGDIAYLNANNVKLKEAETRTTIKMAYAQEKYAAATRKVFAMSLADRQKARGGSIASTMPGFGDNGQHADYGKITGNAVKMTGAAFGAASGMTFAGAAMAGSTTFDTLTGSLKMLSLAAGAKTQARVLGVAKAIQALAKSAENAPNGMMGGIGGGMAGAAIGARFGGIPGAITGGLIGSITGGSVDKIANDFSDKRNMVNKLKSDPNQITKMLLEIDDMEKEWFNWMPFVGNGVEIAKRRGAIRTAEARNKIKNEGDDFKMAGMGLSAKFVGLTESRQGEADAFSGTGALGIDNMIEEIKRNTEAMKSANWAAGWKPTANPGNVQPPSN